MAGIIEPGNGSKYFLMSLFGVLNGLAIGYGLKFLEERLWELQITEMLQKTQDPVLARRGSIDLKYLINGWSGESCRYSRRFTLIENGTGKRIGYKLPDIGFEQRLLLDEEVFFPLLSVAAGTCLTVMEVLLFKFPPELSHYKCALLVVATTLLSTLWFSGVSIKGIGIYCSFKKADLPEWVCTDVMDFVEKMRNSEVTM